MSPTGLPWDNPDSDPLGNVIQWFTTGGRAYSRQEYERRRKHQMDGWFTYHRIYCFADIVGFIDDDGNQITRCTGCGQSVLEVLPKSKAAVKGTRPQKITIDEAPGWTHPVDLGDAPRPDPAFDRLALCMDHPWLQTS